MLFLRSFHKFAKIRRCVMCSTCLRLSNRNYSASNKGNEELDSNKPISYINSQANQWQARHTRMGSNSVDESLWYEPYVILGSITIFMIYFCILREENDIDMEFDKSLYSRVEGMEESQLRLALKYNEERGLDTKDIIERLRQIEIEKKYVG